MKIKISTNVILCLSILSLIVGFFLNEDSSGSGGFIIDYKQTWGYIEALKANIFVSSTNWTIHTPLHYIIISKLSIFIKSDLVLRFVFLVVNLSIPYLFFLCLRTKFPKIDVNNLVLLSAIIIILPAYRSSLIWANAHATGLVFFLFFLYFFLVWEKENFKNKISKNILSQIVFLALAVYTRQYYAYFYLYLMMIYLQKLSLKKFIIISFLVFLLSLPGFILIFNEPKILKGSFDYNFSNTILISSSIISFYLVPFYFINYFNKKKLISFFRETKLSKFLTFSTVSIFIIFLSLFYDYNYKLGGGFFLKFSYLILNNNLIFLLTSFFGIIFLIDFYLKNKNNIYIILIFLFGFSAYMIFQKYFEPLFLMLAILTMNNNMITKIISNVKSIYILYIYFLVYLLSAISNQIFKITKLMV